MSILSSDEISNNNLSLPTYNIYYGGRYIVKFEGQWDAQHVAKDKNGNTLSFASGDFVGYESLSGVTHEGASYISKCAVPIGIDISNSDYWAKAFDYNIQFTLLSEDFTKFKQSLTNEMNGFSSKQEGLFDDMLLSYENKVKNYTDGVTKDFDGKIKNITDLLNETKEISNPILDNYVCDTLLASIYHSEVQGYPLVKVEMCENGSGYNQENTESGYATSATYNLMQVKVKCNSPTLTEVYVPKSLEIPNKTLNKINDTLYTVYDSTGESTKSAVIELIF